MEAIAAAAIAFLAPHVLGAAASLLAAHGVPLFVANIVVSTAAKKIIGKTATVAGAAIQAGAEQTAKDLRAATDGKVDLAFDRELSEREKRVAQPTKYGIPPGLGKSF